MADLETLANAFSSSTIEPLTTTAQTHLPTIAIVLSGISLGLRLLSIIHRRSTGERGSGVLMPLAIIALAATWFFGGHGAGTPGNLLPGGSVPVASALSGGVLGSGGSSGGFPTGLSTTGGPLGAVTSLSQAAGFGGYGSGVQEFDYGTINGWH